jgi:hypothetical protein
MTHRSTKRQTTAMLGVLVMALAACEPTTRSATSAGQGYAGREAYLCCTLRFNKSRDASDANYDYPDKIVLPAGTRVRVVRADYSEAVFVPEGETERYSIVFRYGRKVLRPADYYARLFVAEDPRTNLGSADVRDAVRRGELTKGMTKYEVIVARGFPPAHRTPSTDADDWLYYTQRKLCEQVHFVDGRVASIEQVPPPQ